MNELATSIEALLLERADWITSAELCVRFGIKERQLRQVGDSPGLCSEFAISGDKGFKHVSCATEEEVRHFCLRLRKHAIGEFVHARAIQRLRISVTRQVKRPPLVFERDTGQVLFPGLATADARKEVAMV